MTDPIRSFYEAHPYPPPVPQIDGDIDAWSDGVRRRFEHSRAWPTVAFGDAPSILVAGCGTSQAVRYAVRYPGAEVVGIDVSDHSLEASRRLADHHGVGNLELRNLPIEDAARLDHRFDLVVSTGVLHHLADPAVGFRALRDRLTDRGALRVMVYGRFGRFGIELLQEFSRRLGVEPTESEIEQLTDTLRELPLGHPISHVLRDTADFRDPGALADALLNPRERSYTVPELLAELDGAGLRFGRWVHQAPYRPQCGAVSEVPHARRIAARPEPEQFALMELFRGTINRHTLIAHRDDTSLPPITSGAESWRDVVAIRAPTLVVVEERLPPGAACAVINQAHTDRDLVLFLDERRRDALAQIDGVTPFGEIDGASAELLEILWLHDAIVTDQSTVASRTDG